MLLRLLTSLFDPPASQAVFQGSKRLSYLTPDNHGAGGNEERIKPP